MKTFLPDDMNLMRRSFREKERCFLSLAASACFSLIANAPRLLHMQAMWPTIEAALGKDELFDFGMPKPRGEFLVYGSACAPSPVTALEVQVRVGNHTKFLHVFGNRHWSATGAPSQPEPFTSMRICPENAFGGPKFPENPLGKGAMADASGFHPLPNIQAPGNLVGSPGDRPFPAGLTAWPMTWPQRMRSMGAVHETYLADSWPALPQGTSPEYFNTAPEDQRIQDFFQGDEVVEMLHMHPRIPHIISSLPGVRARLFIHRNEAKEEIFTEVPCQAETVWLFPEQDRGIILFRGVTETESEELEDVLHLFARWEPLGDTPKPLDHYFCLFKNELQSTLETQTPPDLEDETAQAPPDQAIPEPKTTVSTAAVAGVGAVAATSFGLEQILREFDALHTQTVDMLVQAGLNPDEVFKKALVQESTPEAIGVENISILMADLEKQSEDLLAKFNVDKQEVLKLLEPQPDAPLPSVDEFIGQLRASGINNPEIETKFLEADAHLKEAVGAVATLAALQSKTTLQPEQEPAAEEPTDDLSETSTEFRESDSRLDVDQVMAMHHNGQSLARLDLTGLDFSERDLCGADFTESILDRCVFQRAHLSKAVFTGAILTAADLDGADLQATDLRQVHAAGASLCKANLNEADLSQGDFAEVNLAGADLNQAILRGAVFEQAGLVGVQARRIQAARASFIDADLTSADLAEADLEKADFTGATLTGANLTGIKAPELRLHATRCTKTIFTNAVLCASRSGQQASFAGANLSGADLRRACWDGVNLSDADLTGAALDNADFSRTNLTQATLRRATARETNFMQADMDGADLTRINLFKGVLRKSNLINTTFQSSNLYGVDFYKARIGNTDLADANIKRTLLAMGLLQ